MRRAAGAELLGAGKVHRPQGRSHCETGDHHQQEAVGRDQGRLRVRPPSPGVRQAVEPERDHECSRGAERARHEQAGDADHEHDDAKRKPPRYRPVDREDHHPHRDEAGRVRTPRPLEPGRHLPVEHRVDGRLPHLDGRHCAEGPEREVDVSPGPQCVRNQPDQAEGGEEPQPRDQPVDTDVTPEEQRIERQTERDEPQREQRPPDEVAALPAPRPDHQRPSEQDDVEEVGDPQVERPQGDLLREPEDDRPHQEGDGPLRAERGQVGDQQQEGRGEEPGGRGRGAELVERDARRDDRQPARHEDEHRDVTGPGVDEPARPRSFERSVYRPLDLSAWNRPGRIQTRSLSARRDGTRPYRSSHPARRGRT